MSEVIKHIITGGTVESQWSPIEDTAIINPELPESHAANYLANITDRYADQDGPKFDSEFVCIKDSRHLSVKDRRRIASVVGETASSSVLVTSGTFLMPDIARNVIRAISPSQATRLQKRVVHTGALIPINGYEMSDGPFNLGVAVATLQAPKGFYKPSVLITMNGLLVDAADVEKDMTVAQFSSLDNTDLLNYPHFTVVPAGGTIDFEVTDDDKLEPASDSAIPGYLRNNVNITSRFSAWRPIMKDSRKLSMEDKRQIVENIQESTDEHVIVTCGLKKITELRGFIRENLRVEDQARKIVLTGSNRPLRGSSKTSDAGYNLGYAYGSMAHINEGVSIALHGKIH